MVGRIKREILFLNKVFNLTWVGIWGVGYMFIYGGDILKWIIACQVKINGHNQIDACTHEMSLLAAKNWWSIFGSGAFLRFFRWEDNAKLANAPRKLRLGLVQSVFTCPKGTQRRPKNNCNGTLLPLSACTYNALNDWLVM